jgi:hypothetical protein
MAFWFTNYNGSLRDYSHAIPSTNLANQWFQLNVAHNLMNHTINVWINRKLVWTQQDNGAGDFYMKDGVYAQNHNPSYQMDCYIKNIHMLTTLRKTIAPIRQTGPAGGTKSGNWIENPR